MIEGFVGSFSRALAPQLAQTIPAEIFVALISQFVQSVGGEEHGIAGREPHRVLVVGRPLKNSRRKASFAEARISPVRDENRVRQARIRKRELPRDGIEETRKAWRNSGLRSDAPAAAC